MLSTAPRPLHARQSAVALAARLHSLAASRASTAVLSIWADPLAGVPTVQRAVRPGATIAALLPAELAHECVVCRFQGVYVLRAEWVRPVAPGDHVEFIVHPQGGGGGSNPLRTILTIAVLLAAQYYAPYLVGSEYGLFAAASETLVATSLVIAGNLAINALLPLSAATGSASNSPATSPAYNTALAGNRARLDGARPVLYGYNRTFPAFAAQPYLYYIDNEQWYCAYLEIGEGEYSVLRIEIADTSIASYSDVEYNVLPPGVAPSLVEPAVVTAEEITGSELTPGRYIGPYAACGPQTVAQDLAFDIAFSALGIINNDGSITAKTVQLRFEARPCDDFGAPTGAWVVLDTEDITASTASPLRLSFRYTLPTAGRYLARAVRTSGKDAATNVANTPQWVGLRAYLQVPAPDTSTTRLEIRMRATEQLSGLTQAKVAVASIRKLRTWSPDTGWSSTLVETRNPAWALADKWTNAVYGDGRPDARCDLAMLAELAEVWDARQDRCDIVFDTHTDGNTADQLVANTGRAKCFTRNGVRTVVRDGAVDLPVRTFSARTIRAGSWSCKWLMPTSQSADGYIVEYWSNRANDWREIECPAPGRTVTDTGSPRYDAGLPSMSRPIRTRLLGVTGVTHALREGLYMAGKLAYRRVLPSWSTELQGAMVAYASAVNLAPALPTWAQSGDVVSWDAETLVMGLSEPPDFTAGGAHSITLERDDGSVHPAIVATAVSGDEWAVQLASEPDFALVCDAADRERPKYIFGPSTTHRTVAKVLGIKPNGTDDEGLPVFDLVGVEEDDRLHELDADLLPVGEEVQDEINLDPVDPEGGGAGGDGGGSTLLLTSLTGLTLNEPSVGSALARYELLANGQVRQTTYPSGSAVRGSEWLIIAPTTTTDTSLFEARATVTAGALTAGTAGTWQALGTTSLWEVANTTADSTLTATLTIELRAIAAAGTILQSVTVVLIAQVLPEPGG